MANGIYGWHWFGHWRTTPCDVSKVGEMMDIVERLGELRLGNKEYDAVVDAIDEIEKLREKVFNLETEVHFDDQTIKSLKEINERLREALQNTYDKILEGDLTEVFKTLRAALKEGE